MSSVLAHSLVEQPYQLWVAQALLKVPESLRQAPKSASLSLFPSTWCNLPNHSLKVYAILRLGSHGQHSVKVWTQTREIWNKASSYRWLYLLASFCLSIDALRFKLQCLWYLTGISHVHHRPVFFDHASQWYWIDTFTAKLCVMEW